MPRLEIKESNGWTAVPLNSASNPLFLNPTGNRLLASQALLERLLSEGSSALDAELVQRLVPGHEFRIVVDHQVVFCSQ